MGLPPGRTNNPSGRKKNVPNKVTRTTKEIISQFVDAKMLELEQIWRVLTPREKALLLTSLIPYTCPKMQAVAVTGEIDFSRLSEPELDRIIERLTTKQ